MSCCPPGQSQNSFQVCGSFDTPTNPDLGQCSPYRVKRTCEAPALPVIECADDTYVTVYDPDRTPPFYVIANLFDSNCDPILDENNEQVTTIIQ